MVMFMNEWEVREAQDWFHGDDQPNLQKGAHALLRLMNWTNSVSDGWPYWQKPIKAAGRLMEELHTARGLQRSGSGEDMTAHKLAALLRPVRAVMREQGVEDTDAILFPKPPKKPKETRWSHADRASSVLQTYALETRPDGRLGDEGSDEFVATVVEFLSDLKHLLYRAGPSILLTELVDRAVDKWDVQSGYLPEGGPDEG